MRFKNIDNITNWAEAWCRRSSLPDNHSLLGFNAFKSSPPLFQKVPFIFRNESRNSKAATKSMLWVYTATTQRFRRKNMNFLSWFCKKRPSILRFRTKWFRTSRKNGRILAVLLLNFKALNCSFKTFQCRTFFIRPGRSISWLNARQGFYAYLL